MIKMEDELHKAMREYWENQRKPKSVSMQFNQPKQPIMHKQKSYGMPKLQRISALQPKSYKQKYNEMISRQQENVYKEKIQAMQKQKFKQDIESVKNKAGQVKEFLGNIRMPKKSLYNGKDKW